MNGRRIVALVSLAAFVALLAVGCSSAMTYQMEPGEHTVSTSGEVTVTEDDNGNQFVELHAAHLPLPHAMDQQKSTLTVWVVPDREDVRPYNVGQLRVDNDDRTGLLEFPTPFRTFDLVVTAEPSEVEAQPSGVTVLYQRIGDD